MKAVFCSSIFNMKDYEHIRGKSKLPLGLADHNLNLNIILGIEENIGKPIQLINNVQIPNYPNYPKKLFKEQKWSHVEGAEDINCGFVNLPIIKHFSRAWTTYCELKKVVKQNGVENICLITYDLHFGISLGVAGVIKRFPRLKTCLIMPDVPGAVLEASSAGNISWSDRISARMKSSFINMYKSYVFLTEQMANLIDTTGKEYVVMEGIYNNHLPELKSEPSDKKVVLYTGQLNPIYGLSNLVNAFLEIIKTEDNYELWLCGGGVMVDEIRELEKKHKEIKYYGYCNGEEIRHYQEQATVLINPRQNTGEYTKYSFPSKTMEYLASGRPMIGYKLDSFPEEYDQLIYYVKDNSIEALKQTIKDVCSLNYNERKEHAEKARKFIVEQKNPKTQCKRIVDMLNID